MNKRELKAQIATRDTQLKYAFKAYEDLYQEYLKALDDLAIVRAMVVHQIIDELPAS